MEDPTFNGHKIVLREVNELAKIVKEGLKLTVMTVIAGLGTDKAIPPKEVSRKLIYSVLMLMQERLEWLLNLQNKDGRSHLC